MSPDELERLSQALCDGFHDVGTRRERRWAAGDGYSTEVFRDNFILLGHAEGAYRPYPPPPDVCFFMCLTPPEAAGGETTVVDGIAMLEAMPAALRQRFEASGVVYESRWERARWRAEFGVNQLGELTQLLAAIPRVTFELDGDVLRLRCGMDAIAASRCGRQTFANGILAHLPRITHPRYEGLPVYVNPSNRVYFGDGEPLPDDVVNGLIDVHDSLAYAHRWQAGDLLMLDNTRYLHGRTMTAGPCERVLLSRFGWLKPARRCAGRPISWPK